MIEFLTVTGQTYLVDWPTDAELFLKQLQDRGRMCVSARAFNPSMHYPSDDPESMGSQGPGYHDARLMWFTWHGVVWAQDV